MLFHFVLKPTKIKLNCYFMWYYSTLLLSKKWYYITWNNNWILFQVGYKTKWNNITCNNYGMLFHVGYKTIIRFSLAADQLKISFMFWKYWQRISYLSAADYKISFIHWFSKINYRDKLGLMTKVTTKRAVCKWRA